MLRPGVSFPGLHQLASEPLGLSFLNCKIREQRGLIQFCIVRDNTEYNFVGLHWERDSSGSCMPEVAILNISGLCLRERQLMESPD